MSDPSPIDPGWCPELRPGMILRHDERRDADLLMMPERAVVLNGTAAAILTLCDGRRAVDELIAACQARFSEGFVAGDVLEFLEAFRGHGWLV